MTRCCARARQPSAASAVVPKNATGQRGAAVMTEERVVEEQGSYRLVERQGRYAVLETRNGQTEGAEARRDVHWTDEAEARRLFGELVRDGERLAHTTW